MAVLTDAVRFQTWAEVMRSLSDTRQEVGISKAELRAAIDALDAFMNTNSGAINTAIPQPARGSLTSSQKALLLMHVIQRRWVEGS